MIQRLSRFAARARMLAAVAAAGAWPGAHAGAATPSCVPATAPVVLPFKSSPPNRGVAPPGFVDLGPGVEVVHGVEVSKWQDNVDFFRIAACGARFAYIRVSAGSNAFNEISYSSLWPQARAAKLELGAYHALSVPPQFQPGGRAARATLSPDEVRQQFAAHGLAQAQLFIGNVQRLLDEEGSRSLGATLAPMLSIGDPAPQPEQARYGPELTTHALVCAWIDAVEASPIFHGQRVILFVQPSVFVTQRLADATCIRPVKRLRWIPMPTPGAVSYDQALARSGDEAIRDFCAPEHGGCPLHEYTNRGGLALGSSSEGLNLTRFLGSADEFQRNMRKGTP